MAPTSRSPRILAPLALAAALLSGGCTVNVEGAPCGVPGTTTDCPADQACGNDRRCSARALACAGTRCTPGAGGACLDPSGASSGVDSARHCTAEDPVCGAWVVDSCGASGLVCGGRSGEARCECPEPAGVVTTVVADPRGSPSRSALPYPNGQASPPECSYGRLTDALFALSTSAAGSVVTVAGPAAAPAVFAAESWPLIVPSTVKVQGATAAGPSIVRAGPDPGGAGTLVRVLGAVEGLRLEASGVRAAGIELACGGVAPALRQVEVSGGSALDPLDPAGVVTGGLRAGIVVTSACGAVIDHARVAHVSGPALLVQPGAGSVQVQGGAYDASEIGIWLRGGTSAVAGDVDEPVSVSSNAWVGIAIGGGPDRSAEIVSVPGAGFQRVAVRGTGGTGVAVMRLDESSSFVTLRALDISGNGAGSRALTSAEARPVGGVLLAVQTPGALVGFTGSRLWSNAGDQVVIESDAAPWDVGPAAGSTGCGPDTNVFACLTRPGSAVRIVGAGSVHALYDVWSPASSPAAWSGWVGPGVNTTANQNLVCSGGPSLGVPTLPTCP